MDALDHGSPAYILESRLTIKSLQQKIIYNSVAIKISFELLLNNFIFLFTPSIFHLIFVILDILGHRGKAMPSFLLKL